MPLGRMGGVGARPALPAVSALTRTEIAGATNTSEATSRGYSVSVVAGRLLVVAVAANRTGTYDNAAVTLSCTDNLGVAGAAIAGGWTQVNNEGSYSGVTHAVSIFYITASHTVTGTITVSTANADGQTAKVYSYQNSTGVGGTGTATDSTYPVASATATLSAAPTTNDLVLWVANYLGNSNGTADEIVGPGTELIETINGFAFLSHAIGERGASTSTSVNVSSTNNSNNNGEIRMAAITVKA